MKGPVIKDRCRRIPEGEPLEARALLIGFYEGPAPYPIQVSLVGFAKGHALVQRSPGSYSISAAGRISPLGLTSISGALRRIGGVEQGTLTLNSATSRATIRLSGPATAPLSFAISDGRAVDPNTTFAYVREQGAGTVEVTISPGLKPGRLALELAFSRS